MKNKWGVVPDLLRWIAVLPGALLAGYITYRVLRRIWILSESVFGGDYFCFHFLVRGVVSNLVAGVAFIFAGVFIAPYYRKYVGIVLAGLLLFVSGAVFFERIISGDALFLLGWIPMNVGAIVSACVVSAICKDLVPEAEPDGEEPDQALDSPES